MKLYYISGEKDMLKMLCLCSFYLINILFSNFSYGQISELESVAKAENTIIIAIDRIELLGNINKVFIKLNNIKTKKPIALNDLKILNTKKIHLFIIDDSLEDYTHIHPIPTHIPGVYEFNWQPKRKGNYKIWVELLPRASNKQEYDMTDLKKNSEIKFNIDKKEFLESTLEREGITFNLSFDSYPLTVNNISTGKISIVHKTGEPFQKLEPVMGAFAYFTAIHEDLKTIIPVHSIGEEPQKSTDRGGPELLFHIEPRKKGFIKLFLKVIIKGKEFYIPFGLRIV